MEAVRWQEDKYALDQQANQTAALTGARTQKSIALFYVFQIIVDGTNLNNTVDYLWNESTANPPCGNDTNCLSSTMYKLWFWSECLLFRLYHSVSTKILRNYKIRPQRANFQKHELGSC